MYERRRLLQHCSTALIAAAAAPWATAAARVSTPAAAPSVGAAIASAPTLAALELVSGGRLGVTLLEVGTGRGLGQRQNERFPMCSTFKSMLVAHVLSLDDAKQLSLDQRLPVTQAQLQQWSPASQRHLGKDMSVRDLCRAAMTLSDNTAANLLLKRVGGPPALTAFLRHHGDAVTRIDRYEPEVNQFAPDDPRDTTSPAAMAVSLARFAQGHGLTEASRLQYADWLIDNQTGDDCLRAGLGKRWRVGDKTGSNGKDTRNDIAVLWPKAGGTPWALVALLQGAKVDSDQRDAVLARVGTLAEAMID